VKPVSIYLTYETEYEPCYFAEKDDKGYPINREEILKIHHIELTELQQQNLWLVRNYHDLLSQQSEKSGLNEKYNSLKYGELSFVDRKDDDSDYEYNDNFGLVRMVN